MSKGRPALPRNGKIRKQVTAGGRKLRRSVKRSGLGVTGYAKKAGVDRVTLHRVMTGERYRHITVDFAAAIHEVDPSIAIEDFCSLTALPAEEADEEDPDVRKRTGTDG